MRHDLMH